MPSGGSRVQSGPAPDPAALNRNRPGDQASWTNLPGAGYDGPVPDWPLLAGGPLHSRELALWEQMWRKPQALMWARLGQLHEVALFCRNFATAEIPGAPVMLQTVILRSLDSLGLSTAGMARHRWRIIPAAEELTERAAPPTTAQRRATAKSRLKVVDADGR